MVTNSDIWTQTRVFMKRLRGLCWSQEEILSLFQLNCDSVVKNASACVNVTFLHNWSSLQAGLFTLLEEGKLILT